MGKGSFIVVKAKAESIKPVFYKNDEKPMSDSKMCTIRPLNLCKQIVLNGDLLMIKSYQKYENTIFTVNVRWTDRANFWVGRRFCVILMKNGL